MNVSGLRSRLRLTHSCGWQWSTSRRDRSRSGCGRWRRDSGHAGCAGPPSARGFSRRSQARVARWPMTSGCWEAGAERPLPQWRSGGNPRPESRAASTDPWENGPVHRGGLPAPRLLRQSPGRPLQGGSTWPIAHLLAGFHIEYLGTYLTTEPIIRSHSPTARPGRADEAAGRLGACPSSGCWPQWRSGGRRRCWGGLIKEHHAPWPVPEEFSTVVCPWANSSPTRWERPAGPSGPGQVLRTSATKE